MAWAKQKIRSPKPPQFDDTQWVVAVKERNSTVDINGKMEKARCELSQKICQTDPLRSQLAVVRFAAEFASVIPLNDQKSGSKPPL